jgi:hypothetical protein
MLQALADHKKPLNPTKKTSSPCKKRLSPSKNRSACTKNSSARLPETPAGSPGWQAQVPYAPACFPKTPAGSPGWQGSGSVCPGLLSGDPGWLSGLLVSPSGRFGQAPELIDSGSDLFFFSFFCRELKSQNIGTIIVANHIKNKQLRTRTPYPVFLH